MGEVYNCSKLGHEDSELVSRRKGAHIKIRFFKRHSSPVEVFRSLHRNPDDKYMNKRKYSDQEILDWALRFVDETILKLKKDKQLNPIYWRDNPFGREAWRRWRETLPKGKRGPAPDTVAKRFTNEHLMEYIKTVKPEWVKYLTAKVTPDDCYNLVIMSARELGHVPGKNLFSSWANKKGVISYMKIQRITGKKWADIRKEVHERFLSSSGEYVFYNQKYSDQEILDWAIRFVDETILKLKKDKRLNPIYWRDNPFGREAWQRWRETLPKGKRGPAPDTVAKRFTNEHLIEYIKTVKPEWVKYLTAKVTPDDCYNLVIMSARELGHIPDSNLFSSWANKKGVISYVKIQRIIGKDWKEIRKEVYKRLLDSGEKYPAQSYVPDKEIISNIKRCMRELKISWLNAKDYDEWVDKQRIFLPKSNALKGRRKWVEWVTLAGGKRVLVKYDYEYIKKCIKEVYEQVGHFPTEAEYLQYRKDKGPSNMPGLWTIINMMKWEKWKEVVVNEIDENIKEGVGVSGEHVLFFSKLSNEKSKQGLWKYIRSVKSYKDVIETFMIFLDLKGFLPSVLEWDKFAEQYHLPDSKKLTMIAAKWWTDILEDAGKYADRILRDNPDMFSNIWNKLSDIYFSDRKHSPSYSNLISWLKVHESVQVPSKFMDYLYMKSQKQEVVHAGRGI